MVVVSFASPSNIFEVLSDLSHEAACLSGFRIWWRKEFVCVR